MYKTDKHLWRTARGDRLVETGHPEAAVLAYPAGTEIPDSEAAKHGLKATSKPADKAVEKAADKSVAKADNKSADDLEQLRRQAENAGVKVDKRWGADKLRAEIEAAGE